MKYIIYEGGCIRSTTDNLSMAEERAKELARRGGQVRMFQLVALYSPGEPLVQKAEEK